MEISELVRIDAEAKSLIMALRADDEIRIQTPKSGFSSIIGDLQKNLRVIVANQVLIRIEKLSCFGLHEDFIGDIEFLEKLSLGEHTK